MRRPAKNVPLQKLILPSGVHGTSFRAGRFRHIAAQCTRASSTLMVDLSTDENAGRDDPPNEAVGDDLFYRSCPKQSRCC